MFPLLGGYDLATPVQRRAAVSASMFRLMVRQPSAVPCYSIHLTPSVPVALPVLVIAAFLAVLVGLTWAWRRQRGGAGWAMRLGFPVATFHREAGPEVRASTAGTARFHVVRRRGRTLVIENEVYANPFDPLRDRAYQTKLVGAVSTDGRRLTFRTALPTSIIWTVLLSATGTFAVMLAGAGAGALDGEPTLSSSQAARLAVVTGLMALFATYVIKRARRRARSFAHALGFDG